jgi:hypothetical protein
MRHTTAPRGMPLHTPAMQMWLAAPSSLILRLANQHVIYAFLRSRLLVYRNDVSSVLSLLLFTALARLVRRAAAFDYHRIIVGTDLSWCFCCKFGCLLRLLVVELFHEV